MESYEKYLEIKWHGRAGQGVMTSASVLAEILVMEGKYVQAFPGFDPGKNNPFVQAYNRISESPIRFHSSITNTDIVAVMDPAVILKADADENSNSGFHCKTNTKKNACYIVNTSLPPRLIHEKLDAPGSIVYTLDTDTIYREEIGEPLSCHFRQFRHFPNIPLMAVLVYCIDWLPMENFMQRLQESLASHKGKTNFIPATSKIIDRSLHEVQKFPESEVGTVNTNTNGNMNTKSNQR